MRRRKREDRRRSQRTSGSTQQIFRASQRSAFGRQNRGRTVSLFFTNYPDDWSQTGDIWLGTYKLRVSMARERDRVEISSRTTQSRIQRLKGSVLNPGISFAEAVKRGTTTDKISGYQTHSEENGPRHGSFVPGMSLGPHLICLGTSTQQANIGPRSTPAGPESSDRRDILCSQECNSSPSCRVALRSVRPQVSARPKGLIPRLRKRVKHNPGFSLGLGKSSGHFGRKILAGGKNLVQTPLLSHISGTSIGDSSIQNRNRVLLLQQELTAEGVWEVGKWLGLLIWARKRRFWPAFAPWRSGIRLEGATTSWVLVPRCRSCALLGVSRRLGVSAVESQGLCLSKWFPPVKYVGTPLFLVVEVQSPLVGLLLSWWVLRSFFVKLLVAGGLRLAKGLAACIAGSNGSMAGA
ncbi:hypothetical protein Ancab_012827 [Ancistrocladus abbreviatus]